MARTPDGKTLLISRANGLLVWRSETESSFRQVELADRIEGAGRGPFPVISLEPSGSKVYYLSLRGDQLNARTLDETGPSRPVWSTPVSQATTLAISLDGRTIAVAERSGTILLIDAVHGTVKERLFPPDDEAGPIESLAFAPGGTTLAIGAREQVRLWGIGVKARPLVRLPGHRGAIRSLTFDTKGTRLAGADEKTIKVWDLTSLRGELSRLGLDW